MIKVTVFASIVLAAACVGISTADSAHHRVKSAVDTAVRPVMAKDAIPGMGVQYAYPVSLNALQTGNAGI